MYVCMYGSGFAGGTFALYSLICRHAKVSLLPNRQHADEALSAYKMEEPPEKNTSKVKMMLEKHKALHTSLLIVVLLGTCMVIGDGLLTPAISGKNPFSSSCFTFTIDYSVQFADLLFIHVVFSAVSGLEVSMSKKHHQCKFHFWHPQFSKYNMLALSSKQVYL